MNDGRAFCKHCQYRLVGLAHDVCPECGKPFDPECRHTFTRHPGWRRWQRPLVGCLLAVAVAYVGSYYCLVKTYWGKAGGVVRISATQVYMDSGVMVAQLAPSYRVGGALASSVYSPIHRLDRKLRAGTWTVTLQQWPLEWAGM